MTSTLSIATSSQPTPLLCFVSSTSSSPSDVESLNPVTPPPQPKQQQHQRCFHYRGRIVSNGLFIFFCGVIIYDAYRNIQHGRQMRKLLLNLNINDDDLHSGTIRIINCDDLNLIIPVPTKNTPLHISPFHYGSPSSTAEKLFKYHDGISQPRKEDVNDNSVRITAAAAAATTSATATATATVNIV